MAPILLKIKGTKLFSPFNEIEDVGDLSTLWRVCTKVKDSLENGSRLENLSWRLWHLHQTLEARGKGRDYRKLSPTTTKQLEKTIRRPSMPKAKPMQIKVRLGKPADGSSRAKPPPMAAADSSSGAAPAAPRARPQTEALAGSSVPAAPAADVPAAEGSATRSPDALRQAAGLPGGDMAAAAAQAAATVAAGTGHAAANLPAAAAHTQAQPQAQMPPPPPPPLQAAPEVYASDVMSFGPSSFLSSGFDLDAPQIEITLDDIFSANSADWSQFGFASLASGQALGMPIPEYGGLGAGGSTSAGGAAHGMWGGMPYPGTMPVSAPYGTSHAHMDAERPDAHDGPICDNCGVTSTPLWRRSIDDTLLCNACGLYFKLHRAHRPKTLRSSAARKDGVEDDVPKTYCTNCKTCKTPLWRRDEAGNPLCNACGLYYKLHKASRPISLKSDVIRKRQRHDTASGAQRKRQGRNTHKPSDAAGSPSSASPGAPQTAPASDAQPPHAMRDQSAAGPPDARAAPPLSAPPASYSANGTQLLNDADAGSGSRGSYSAGVQEYGYAHQHQHQHQPPANLRHPPRPPDGLLPPLQHSATLPMHHYSAAEQPNPTPAGGEPPRPVSGSINIPISPPLAARPDAYFGRTPSIGGRSAHEAPALGSGASIHLPPLGLAHGSSGDAATRTGPGGANDARALQSTMGHQPLGAGSEPTAPYASGQHPPSLYYGARGDAPAPDPKHGADRQLPSLAELASASAARRGGHHHYSGPRHYHDHPQQQRHQQHYPPLN
ncbi:hypothetical protein LPJ61_000946 [Coemansia biformis]|uniref:GATA-type domain-containing protein n=1 Tax=Coemansia biformis TaxID=1286918 RepID=A0A9W7YHQ1_9FUNG|nr:hypothetical protein LPJ61_000946 [Coemansia biformis]